MKANVFFLILCIGIIPLGLHSQNSGSEANTQIIEFSNLRSVNNHYSGEIYCFDETKVTFQLRTSALNGKFYGTMLFVIGQESYTATTSNNDYFKEVTLCLPKGSTSVSITLLPNIENQHQGEAHISIVDTGKGRLGLRNLLSSVDK